MELPFNFWHNVYDHHYNLVLFIHGSFIIYERFENQKGVSDTLNVDHLSNVLRTLNTSNIPVAIEYGETIWYNPLRLSRGDKKYSRCVAEWDALVDKLLLRTNEDTDCLEKTLLFSCDLEDIIYTISPEYTICNQYMIVPDSEMFRIYKRDSKDNKWELFQTRDIKDFSLHLLESEGNEHKIEDESCYTLEKKRSRIKKKTAQYLKRIIDDYPDENPSLEELKGICRHLQKEDSNVKLSKIRQWLWQERSDRRKRQRICID